MSAISEKVRTALFEKLNVSAVTNLAVGGVWFKEAPSVLADDTGEITVQVEFPFVVFDRIPGSVDRAITSALKGERDLWMIKAIVDPDSSGTMSPAQLGEAILEQCEIAIGGSLTIQGYRVSACVRRNDMPAFTTDQSDRQVWQFGYFLDVYSG